jgi:adenylate cyclase, class 2
MPRGTQETEIKLPARDAAAARRMLQAAGFRVATRRHFEANTVFDMPDLALRRNSMLLRIRHAGAKKTLTFKGTPVVAKHKSREELETEIPDAALFSTILERLGFAPVFRYEKYRTEFEQPGRHGTATVDETPIGVFMELEGTPAWIDRTARALGFAERDYITASYGRLYLDWCREHGAEPSGMVFSAGSSSSRSAG